MLKIIKMNETSDETQARVLSRHQKSPWVATGNCSAGQSLSLNPEEPLTGLCLDLPGSQVPILPPTKILSLRELRARNRASGKVSQGAFTCQKPLLTPARQFIRNSLNIWLLGCPCVLLARFRAFYVFCPSLLQWSMQKPLERRIF